MEAIQELESERPTIEEQVEQRTSAYRTNNENQLKILQNQMRHSYTFGSNSQDYGKNMNQTATYGRESNSLANDLSLQFAVRSVEEKSVVEKMLLESEYLILRAKSEAKSESYHRELVTELQDRLQEAAGR